jgi:hypothetical protein
VGTATNEKYANLLLFCRILGGGATNSDSKKFKKRQLAYLSDYLSDFCKKSDKIATKLRQKATKSDKTPIKK